MRGTDERLRTACGRWRTSGALGRLRMLGADERLRRLALLVLRKFGLGSVTRCARRCSSLDGWVVRMDGDAGKLPLAGDDSRAGGRVRGAIDGVLLAVIAAVSTNAVNIG